jgi:hypothetical protein
MYRGVAEMRRAMTGAATSWACSMTAVLGNLFITLLNLHISAQGGTFQKLTF